MLKGKSILLRPVRERDLDQLYAYHVDIDNRGDFFPHGIVAEPIFRRRFQETGFWEKDDGMLLLVSPGDEILGYIILHEDVIHP